MTTFGQPTPLEHWASRRQALVWGDVQEASRSDGLSGDLARPLGQFSGTGQRHGQCKGLAHLCPW